MVEDGPIVPEPGSRLEQLVRTRARLQPKLDELIEQMDAVKAGLKSEMAAARPGQTPVTLVSPLLPKPLTLTAKTSNRVDTKKLKADYPEIHSECLKPTTTWELR